MAKRRSYRRKRKSNATGIGVLIMVIAISGFGALAYVGVTESQRPEVDQATLCPVDGPAGHLAILLDTTDPLSMTQLQAARQRIEESIYQAPIGTRVSFSTVSPENEVRGGAFFSVCKPPSGEDASIFNQNPRLIAEKYEEDFLSPVGEALDSLLTLKPADSSPIMEGLQEFITKIPGFITTDKTREIVVMSDLIQHNDSYSFYRNLSWDSFESSNGPSRLSRNLGGAKVTVLRIPRNIPQRDIVDDFWVNYFETQGISRIKVHTIGDL
ncbi:hypothetical protein [Onishia taeanensis]